MPTGRKDPFSNTTSPITGAATAIRKDSKYGDIARKEKQDAYERYGRKSPPKLKAPGGIAYPEVDKKFAGSWGADEAVSEAKMDDYKAKRDKERGKYAKK